MGAVLEPRTCMSTFCPSPLYPSRIAVTTTNWSLATKLRTHRSYLAASWGETGCRSNFKAAERGSSASNRQLTSLASRSMANNGVGGVCSGWAVVSRQMYTCRGQGTHVPMAGLCLIGTGGGSTLASARWTRLDSTLILTCLTVKPKRFFAHQILHHAWLLPRAAPLPPANIMLSYRHH